MIKREITTILLKVAKQFPCVGVMGPRQSGKTTLVKQVFSNYSYVTLEDIDKRVAAQEDPKKFFATYSNSEGLIIDEIQNVPELFSYLQGIVDQNFRPGFFIITGSQNFLMQEKITQTLAGRIALLTLLPLTVSELSTAQLLPDLVEKVMIKGFYPRVYAPSIDFNLWFSNYITTYVERDVRQILNISNINSFQKFLQLCAARIGNILNYSDLARDCNISSNTASAWISVLEASYIIKLLQPYHKNFNKRVIKSPKIYFYDTGLVLALLGISDYQELFIHPIRGAIFENFAISELCKYYYNLAKRPNMFFFRDVQGHEVDCLIEKSYTNIIPIEIKSGMTINRDFFNGIIKWQSIADQEQKSSYIIYAGSENQTRTNADVISWKNIQDIILKN